MALKGMERTTLGITAGLAILAAAIEYLHPHLFFRRPIKAHLLRYDFLCLLAYRMYAALRKVSHSL